MMNAKNSEAKRVLVIDDEPDNVAGTIIKLEERELMVDKAHTKMQAMEALARRDYDGILLDLMLPVVELKEPIRDKAVAENGLEILRALLSGAFEPTGSQRTRPVFIITSLGPDTESVAEARKLGVRAVFGKPALPVYVAESIRIALETL